jgi:hypothetical protein
MHTTINASDRKAWKLDNGDEWGAYKVGPSRWVGYHTPKDGRQELLKIYTHPDDVRRMAVALEPQQLELELF